MFGLASLLPVKTALSILATEIEKQLFIDLSRYDMIWLPTDTSGKLEFKIYQYSEERSNELGKPVFKIDRHLYEDQNLASLIKATADEKIKELGEDITIMAVVISWSKDTTHDYAQILYKDKTNQQLKYKFDYGKS